MQTLSWCEILIVITALAILIKILRDNYNDTFGDKK